MLNIASAEKSDERNQ